MPARVSLTTSPIGMTIGKAEILGCNCECANGLRTVGCCSHIVAIIYYFAHVRYLARVVKPARMLTNLFNNDDCEPLENDDSDED